ncbi:hypothetical protein BTJ40_15700 [Microbulbifer sp. A4B17]|uniref:hypothetical protein n=1 Tax=Microbulbifer sp. A4B17 TaxID=359370 RepID=UPI000D52DB98|nr:hypothetical protein [Microbulbifer sp. A4B17]AWF82157.1 hypothetical protein BTJ40_15700 [Microbulbifer sp. A4B17]
MENPAVYIITLIAGGLATLCWFLIRRNHVLSEKIGILQASIDSKDKELQRLITEREEADKACNEAIKTLSKENEKLKSAISQYKKPVHMPQPIKPMGSGIK